MGLFSKIAQFGGFGLAGAMINNRSQANKTLQGLIGQDPTYVQNPFVKKRLGLALNYVNGQMPGAGTAERGIQTAGANFTDQVSRTATDPSQALALDAAGQGTTDNAETNLGLKEGEYQKSMLDNLNNAYAGEVAEGDKSYEDQIRKYQDLVGIKGAQSANKSGAFQDIINLLGTFTNFGVSSGFKPKTP